MLGLSNTECRQMPCPIELKLGESGIEAALPDQLVMSAFRDYRSLVENQDPVRHLYGCQSVGNDQGRTL